MGLSQDRNTASRAPALGARRPAPSRSRLSLPYSSPTCWLLLLDTLHLTDPTIRLRNPPVITRCHYSHYIASFLRPFRSCQARVCSRFTNIIYVERTARRGDVREHDDEVRPTVQVNAYIYVVKKVLTMLM